MTSVSGIRHDRSMTASPNEPLTGPSRHGYGPSYEDFISRIYRSALLLGAPTRDGLAEVGYQDDDITVGVTELVARGFIRETPDPDTWEIVPPRTALGAWAEQVEQQLSVVRATSGQMDLMWRRALGEQQARELPLELDLLADVEDITHRTGALLSSATRRCWWAVDGSPASRSVLRRAEEIGLFQARSGVDVRIMLDTSLLQDDTALAFLHEAVRAGHQVRVGNGIPFSLALGDETALLDLSSFDRQGQGSMQSYLAAMVNACARLLDEIFVLCTAYGEASLGLTAQDGVPLDERDRRILSLLTVGTSDQVVARQLGVSVRTVERRVRVIMEQLGAATRLQAGVQAVRRGWL